MVDHFLAKERLRAMLMGAEIAPMKGSKDYDSFLIKNDIAYAERLIACKCDICFGVVNSSHSELMQG